MTRKRKSQTHKTTVHTPSQNQFVLPIEYDASTELTLHYVDNMSITHTGTEFSISYFQSQLPTIMAEEDWQKVDKIKSKCVARIVFSPAKMPLFIDAMVRNWNKFLESNAVKESEDAGNIGTEGKQADNQS